MVSGFFTSPWDQLRIFSGAARPIRMARKLVGSMGFSSKNPKNFSTEYSFEAEPSAVRDQQSAQDNEEADHGLNAER
jgi:hypothetical protein